VVNGWNAGPVDVETGHRGGVRDPEGGTDRPADALVGERRGRSVPAPLPAAVDDAVKDQPAMVSGCRRRRISPPWSGRQRRRLAQLQTGIPRRRDTFAVGRGLSPAALRTSFHDVGGIEERANAGGKRRPCSRRVTGAAQQAGSVNAVPAAAGEREGKGARRRRRERGERCPPPPEREGKVYEGTNTQATVSIHGPHIPTPCEMRVFCTRQSSLKIRKLLRK
jgi:hypothetical protein